jgi:hypothetical protein
MFLSQPALVVAAGVIPARLRFDEQHYPVPLSISMIFSLTAGARTC